MLQQIKDKFMSSKQLCKKERNFLSDIYSDIYEKFYANDFSEKQLADKRMNFYRIMVLNNLTKEEDILNFVPKCIICKEKRSMIRDYDFSLSCVNKECMKQAKPISLKLSRERLAKEYAKKSTLEICKEYDPETKRTKNGWLEAIGLRYQPFIEKLYHDPSLLNDARHLNLCKYWALNNVTTFEEARNTIPLCKYCYVNRVLPRVNKPDVTGSCHHIECQKAFKYEAIEKGIEKKYGVKNINEIEEIRKLKSEKLKEANRVNKDSILNKRIITCNEKYGVDNVSQNESIKDKKCKTFEKNYGKDNIFKRSDLMKGYWLNSLGVENPKFDAQINLKRIRNWLSSVLSNSEHSYKYNDKFFGLLSKGEKTFIEKLFKKIDFNLIETNHTIFEGQMDGVSRIYIPDVTIFGEFYIELKSGFDFLNFEYVKYCDTFMRNEHFYYFIHIDDENMGYMYQGEDGYILIYKGADFMRCANRSNIYFESITKKESVFEIFIEKILKRISI